MRIEETPSSPPAQPLARRGLMLGAGLAVLATGAVASRQPAAAEPTPSSKSEGVHAPAAARKLSPVASTVASPPVSGYTYRHVSWLDFQPESGTANRTYGGLGAYSSGSSPYLWATVEIPAGALVRDVEWYLYNNSGTPVAALARLWGAGTGTLFSTLIDTSVATSAAGVQVVRSVVSSADYGPHPLGTKIALGLNTNGASSVQINGARIGFSLGSGTVGLLPAPVRVYDSRVAGGKLAASTVRTITLPSSIVPPGAAGVLVNITAVSGERSGVLTVYPGNRSQPAASTVNFGVGAAIANMIFVGVSSSRQIKMVASRKVHVVVDVTGIVG